MIDSGIDYNHEDIKGNLWVNVDEVPGNNIDDDDNNGYIDDYYGYDFVNNDSDPQDDRGHGTWTSGIIAATGNNTVGTIGVDYRARIMAVKGLNKEGKGTDENLAKCVVYAVDNGAKVLNNSYGVPGYAQVLKDDFDYAFLMFSLNGALQTYSKYRDSNFSKLSSSKKPLSNLSLLTT